ncbi:hypothetical protein R1flu_010714 [Riccia fluitans]|uniref:Uncharacterized protein n=1 Tax=Riccia fluitans TaxID=41844 RepID=A0ABD1Z9X4_9MARC
MCPISPQVKQAPLGTPAFGGNPAAAGLGFWCCLLAGGTKDSPQALFPSHGRLNPPFFFGKLPVCDVSKVHADCTSFSPIPNLFAFFKSSAQVSGSVDCLYNYRSASGFNPLRNITLFAYSSIFESPSKIEVNFRT